jgi:hypothetical protein
VVLVKTNVSEKRIASIIRERRMFLVSLDLLARMIEAVSSSETSALTRATLRHISEDGIRYSHKTNKQTPWPLVRERTIPTDRPPLVNEI